MISSIAICKDNYSGWHQRFVDSLEQVKCSLPNLHFEIIDIDCHDWIDVCLGYDAILYKPGVLGVEASQHYKEKVFFIEKHLNKLVFPNYQTVWHYESKIAQSYLFSHYSIQSPNTFVSFDYHDASLFVKSARLPIVFKESYGAGGSKVKLFKDRLQLQKVVKQRFASQLWKESKRLRNKAKYIFLLSRSWFWRKIFDAFTSKSPYVNTIYLQELAPKNTRDLRITVIGGKYAYAFWRLNRKNDFRASGSGFIDYTSEIPDSPVLYCIEKSKEFGFDSMAYDLVYKGNEFEIIEMSCTYSDTALFHAPGYWYAEHGELQWVPGNYWPQSVWIRALLEKLKLVV